MNLNKMFTKKLQRHYSDILKSSYNKINMINCTTQNIHQNLALENYFFHHADLTVPTLMMWRNDKTIVIGKHQNPFKECFMNKIEEDNVAIARRKSGGGAVYQDLGNTCFSFFIPIYDDTSPLDTRNKNNEVILKALEQFGLNGEISGRNDLELNGKKFSGSAYQLDLGTRNRRKKALHHGTLLLDVQFDDLWKYLNPNKKKLESKGVDSVVSRVVNLCTVKPELNHDVVSEAMFESFKEIYDWCEPTFETIDDPLSVSPHVQEFYDKITNRKWLYGESPQFTYNIETRFDWGIMDVFFQVEKGSIIGGKAYSDCLVPELIDFLNYELDSKSYEYSKTGLDLMCEILSDKFEGNDSAQNMIKDLNKWIIDEI